MYKHVQGTGKKRLDLGGGQIIEVARNRAFTVLYCNDKFEQTFSATKCSIPLAA